MTTEQYNKCVEDYTEGVYRFILKMVRDDDTSRNIVQEAFVRLWENRDTVQEGKEKPYLFTVAYRVAVDGFRERSRLTLTDEDFVLEREPAFAEEGRQGLSEALGRLIDRLPAIQKTVLLLRDYEGYSYREIGTITSLSESQVKVYIFRARLWLRQQIGRLDALL